MFRITTRETSLVLCECITVVWWISFARGQKFGTLYNYMKFSSLQWHHNGHDCVWNHQSHDCLLNRLFRRRSKKTSKLRVTGLCAENSPVTGEFPAQRAINAENVSIWWHHHVMWVSFVISRLTCISWRARSNTLLPWSVALIGHCRGKLFQEIWKCICIFYPISSQRWCR